MLKHKTGSVEVQEFTIAECQRLCQAANSQNISKISRTICEC